jgi:serine/threonine-protein kinase
MFATGDILAGKFQIERVLGQGGMGFVVAATHIHLGQRVALKFLLPELASDRAVVERFLREARSSAQLRSEHICRVSDVGMLDNGAPYFVMELLEGRDLASILAERGPLPVPILVDYIVQACLGLAEAHAAQIVHRDLKPANLFLTARPDGSSLIKVVDFGIAKAASNVNLHLTRTDTVMGSPGYMSPEQLRSTRTVDVRSDIWALGVILFELSSGRQPFTAESITDLALRIAMDPTPPLHSRAAPAGFERVVYRCLEKDPARRFQDVGQLATALASHGGPTVRERALGVTRVLSVAPSASLPAATTPAAAVPTTLGSSAASLQTAPIRRGRWGILLGAVVALALGGLAVVKLRGEERASGPPVPGNAPRSLAVEGPAADAGAPMVTAPADAAPDGPGQSTATLPVDAAAAPAAAPAVRKVTRPRPTPKAGSDNDVGESRL